MASVGKPYCISFQNIQAALSTVRPFVKKTPIMTCSHLNQLSNRNLFFKCENLQKTGSFKFRGACNAVSKVVSTNQKSPDRELSVVTHSSGNHAQAVSLAAQVQGVTAHIVMPSNSPAVKKEAVRSYGGLIVECEPTEQSRVATADQVAERTGATMVHPNQSPDVMAGQGTMVFEILEQVERVDAIVVPVGGGGMLSGVSVAAKKLCPHAKIYAAEPKNADDCAVSMARGELTPLPAPPVTVCDALKTSIGPHTWPIIRDHVDDVITVTEEEIKAAMRLVWERMKLVIEPSSAVGVAAVMTDRFQRLPADGHQNIVVILCGGNVDLEHLPWMR
ncbi:serine racemase-like isoform X1 [Branchiostoma floridae]|uniref:L-serine ammonia-lyase n=2 Tax=Branchiostoma floridae TaxID=7739 RepID=A0A9J7LMX5_BRAFL|nr:serine racemase-like isoform X1 [Branchiostoma floridae]XP_035685129.1 serine racemase-like isoform X1 [Branchiostoma floridae]